MTMIIRIKDLNESWTRYDIYICNEQGGKLWTQKLFTCKVITVSCGTKNHAVQEVTNIIKNSKWRLTSEDDVCAWPVDLWLGTQDEQND